MEPSQRTDGEQTARMTTMPTPWGEITERGGETSLNPTSDAPRLPTEWAAHTVVEFFVKVFQSGQRVQAVPGELYQAVVEQIEGGEAFEVVEGLVVNRLDLVLVQKQSVQGPEASKRVLVQAPQTIAVQEQVAQVAEVHECVILQELQVKRVEPTQPVERVFRQRAQVAVVSEVQLLEQREAVERGRLDVSDVVGVYPQSDRVGAEVSPK
ncbi:hypothetical protein EYF80_023718 [Liparis tanakae]|uniref:Uncharacterized protein n=1 Tax=Liparis tanakae TaxID=230148 RepID=A0A4Z2HKG2_9TELE|nr:hypothetical protein EYF80_023718 [Liparis tanakae]